MASEKRVRDLMGFSSLVEVSSRSTIEEVVKASLPALKDGYNPMILVKEDRGCSRPNEGDIVGMLCWDDVLGALVPQYAKGDMKMEVFWEGLFMDQWRSLAQCNVGEIMRRPVAVEIDELLSKVAYVLVENRINSVLVKDRGKVVGTISAGDLFNQLFQYSA